MHIFADVSVNWQSVSDSVAEDGSFFTFTVDITGDIDSNSVTTIQLSAVDGSASNSYYILAML